MTVESIHDALTLLPADLVAEADKRRFRKTKIIPWHRWTAMAACLVLLAGCGLLIQSWRPGKSQFNESLMAAPAAMAEDAPAEANVSVSSKEAARGAASDSMEAAGIEEQSAAMDTGTLPPGILDITWVKTPLEGDSSLSVSGEPEVALIRNREMLEDYLTGRGSQNGETLKEGTEGFDEEWFICHDLLMLRLICPEDTSVTDIREQNGHWEIELKENTPESPAGESHILIPVEKGVIGSAEDVTPLFALP